MQSITPFVAAIVATAAVFAEAQPAPKAYSSGPTLGQVVDFDSGAPLEGAVVVGRWEWRESRYVYGGPPFENHGQSVHTGEAVTSRDGHFNIAAWGPTMRARGMVEDDAPRLLAFKQGYKPFSQTVKAGTTIKLKKFAGEPKAYAQLLAKFQDSSDGLSWTWDESSLAIPKMVMALHRERIRLGADGAAILGADRMPGRSGEGVIVDSSNGRDTEQHGVVWIEWTMRRTDGGPGSRRVVQTMRSASFTSRTFHVSPWILPGPPVAGWEIDPAVKPKVRVYVTGYQRSPDIPWDEKGAKVSVTKLDGSRGAVLAELRARRKDIDAQLALGDRAEALVLQEDMLSNFQFQCTMLTPDLQAGLCFDAKSDVVRAIYTANHRNVVEQRPPLAQHAVAMPARPPTTIPVKGFSIEVTRP